MKNRYHLFSCSAEKFARFFVRRIPVFCFVLSLYSPFVLRAQKVIETPVQAQFKKDAADSFETGNLIAAYPLYSQLLSNYPHDPMYNYRFGACMLYANGDKRKAEKYIQYGMKQGAVENLAYYYLGRAQHLNYEFDKAMRSYEKFEQIASSSEIKKYPVKHLIEMCQNGKQLLVNPDELDVLRKKELKFSIFFEAYAMHANGGSLILEPDEFKSKIDKKNKLVNLMYVTPDKMEAFFSSYGNSEDNGRDIYVIKRKPGGAWGTAVSLGSVINTAFDEDYPVYDAPRNTLYFSSKGHNSMGGYDIFGSIYNDTTQTWSQPYNLDFPINTPDDDILLVPDTSGKVAFFASARSSPEGKVNVYKVALHLHPPGTIVVAGSVSKAGGKDAAYSIITVKDSTGSQVIAMDSTSAQDGSYSFNLPGSGKYIFTVEDSTHKGQSRAVYLANAEAKIALEENIQFDSSGALRIKDHKTEKYNDSASRLAYIQKEAQMDVNVDTNSIQSVIAQSTPSNPKVVAATTPTVVTNHLVATQPATSLSSNNPANSGLNTNPPIVAANNSATSSQPPSVAPANNLTNLGSNTNPSTSVAANNSTTNSQPSAVVPSDNTANSITNTNPTEVANNTSQPSSVVPTDNTANSTAGTNPTEIANNTSQSSSVVPSDNTVNSTANSNPTEVANNTTNNPQPSSVVPSDNTANSTTNANPTEIANNTTNNQQPSAVVPTDNTVNSTTNTNPTEAANNTTNSPQSSSVVPSNNADNSNNNSNGVAQSSSNNLQAEAQESPRDVQLEEDKQQLNDKATNAIDYANNEMEQSLQLQQRATEISTNPGTANSDSVAILLQESRAASEKGMEAYRVAAEYKSDVASKQVELNKVDNISSSAGADNTTNETSTTKTTPGNLIRQQAEEVKDDSTQVAASNEETNQEIVGLRQKSEDFIAQAGQTNDPQQKIALLRQADDLAKSKDEKQGEIKENTIRLQQLHNEYAWLNNKAKKADSVSVATANTGNNTNAISPEVQKEIDAYAATNGSDSSTISSSNEHVENGTVANQNQVAAQTPGNVTSSNGVETNQNTQAANGANNSNNSSKQDINQSTQTTSAANTNRTNNPTNSSGTELDQNTQPANVANTDVVKNSSISPNTESHSETASAIEQKNLDNSSVEQANKQDARLLSSVEYSDTVTASLGEQSQIYYVKASVLNDTVQKIRNEAKAEQNKSKSEVLYNRADSIDAVTFQLNSKADEMNVQANTKQYSTNTEQIEKIKTQLHNLQSDRIDAAKNTLKDADDSYNKSVAEKDSANSTAIPTNKQKYMASAKRDLALAIVKQQEVEYLYFEADSAQSVGPKGSSKTDSDVHLTYSDFRKTFNFPAGSSQPIASQSTVLSPRTEASTSEVKIQRQAPVDSLARSTSSVNSNSTPDTASIFTDRNKSSYSAAKPIPIDPPKTEGLVFGVQVGAFRNAIPPDLFKGFEPIVGLKTPEGYIRYVAGVFKTIDPAKEAAVKIRDLGYPGAFVVAFYNGKRIPIKEALAKLGISVPPDAIAQNSQTNGTQGTPTISDPTAKSDSVRARALVLTENTITPSKKELIDKSRRDEKAIKDTVPPPANSLNDIKGLVYTVQVGSFATLKGFSRLRKIKDLYYSNADGAIKYNSGIYSNLADAREAKAIIVANSAVKDAFVTMYYNGKRMTPTQAANLLHTGVTGTTTETSSAPVPVQKQPDVAKGTNTPAETVNGTGGAIDSSSFVLASGSRVVYTVRIASFTGELPVDTVNKLLTYASEGIEPFKEGSGGTAYYAGALTEYKAAKTLQQKFINGGFHRATVEAYYQGKKISIQDAQLIKNK